jgi:hypothetical protein
MYIHILKHCSGILNLLGRACAMYPVVIPPFIVSHSLLVVQGLSVMDILHYDRYAIHKLIQTIHAVMLQLFKI